MSEQVMNEDSSELEQLAIEVVYGTPIRQEIISCTVEPNTTIEQAILASGIVAEFPEIDLAINNVGIWNRAAKLTDIVKDLDRIEVYRPLLADPKEVRKRRAEKAKEEGRADKVTGGRVDPRRSKAGET
ncbi:MAG: RnfH family protein [Cognaticolwellia sp.]|jgi:putative ubiquitin-RnfH superfamily antitoxin RatB of RatAB toxin-antitoxin module